jgi:hypothetical protein
MASIFPAADVSDPAGGVIDVTDTDRGDGYWTLDGVGDPDKAWVGRSVEFTTREVDGGDLATAFPFVVEGGRLAAQSFLWRTSPTCLRRSAPLAPARQRR